MSIMAAILAAVPTENWYFSRKYTLKISFNFELRRDTTYTQQQDVMIFRRYT